MDADAATPAQDHAVVIRPWRTTDAAAVGQAQEHVVAI